MIKVAVLDDYQNVFKQIIDIQNYSNKFEFKVFNEPFQSQNEAIVLLESYEVLFEDILWLSIE